MNIIVDYTKLKDAELISVCRDRNITPPINEDGRIIRAEAIRTLKEKDAVAALHDESERVTVVFHNTGNPSAGPYVFASINEKNFQAPYEKKVSVPKYFLTECIDRACTVRYEQKQQMDGTIGYNEIRNPVYSYTVIN